MLTYRIYFKSVITFSAGTCTFEKRKNFIKALAMIFFRSIEGKMGKE
jgi:hypothetical protein